MVSLSPHQQRTVGFLKPDVIDRKAELMDLIKSNDQWKVTFEQELILSLGEAKVLYPQDTEALWLSSHPIYVFILQGNNVVQCWQDFVGPKDPEEAKKVSLESVRSRYGLDWMHNVCHASGSDKEAQQDLIWLQGLVVDDLSIQLDSTFTSSSDQINGNNNNNNKTQPSSKPSKLKKPTSVATSKIGVTSATISAPSSAASKQLSSTSSNSSASSASSSAEAKKKSTQKQSMTIPRPRSSHGSRPTTPSGTPSKTPKTPTILKTPTTKKITTTTTTTATTTTTKSAVSKAQASSKGRKETKTSRLGARSELATKQSPDSVPTVGPSSNKHLANNRGISKNTPGVSVLTGRTRKNSRLEKRKDTTTMITSTPPTVTEDDPTNLRQSDENTRNGNTNDKTSNTVAESSLLVSRDTPLQTNDDDHSDSITNYGNDNNNNNAPYATESVNTLTSASTSCSQHTRDSDHDAEVAAATSSTTAQFMMNTNTSNTIRVDSPSDLMDRRRSSSFSPASIASSLTRPETPEVDNLRQRFESLAKTPTGQTTLGTTPTKRNSSISPEIASRIKDLKPKDPAGSRVKSMVEFFMDEKLHKWEF